MATSSFYRDFQKESQDRVAAIKEHILGGDGIHLHWIDNYARFISRSSIYLIKIYLDNVIGRLMVLRYVFLLIFVFICVVSRFW